MLNLFQRKRPAMVRSAPEGQRLYAVGDVHGRLDALDVLIDAILDDAKTAEHPVLVMLGDYIDRGPQSAQVIERLIWLSNSPALETRFVRGNHDETMLKFLTEPSVGATWCGFGGAETLASYGVAAPLASDSAEAWEAASQNLGAVLPATHLRFLKSLEPALDYGDFFFTHAGVRPGVGLDDQDPHDLMWIREEFLRDSRMFNKVIVHGHTPEEEPFVNDRRIGVDTGAYATGCLTAIVLEGVDRRLIQARVGGRSSIEHINIARTVEQRRA